MEKNIIKIILISCLIVFTSSAQNNIDNLINVSEWNSLFPNRAGINIGHPQGYNSDFYSFINLKTAIDEMSDYLVEIRKKPGVWGELTTITKKSTNLSYIYSDVAPSWHSNTTTEVNIQIDFEDFANESSNINNKRELAAFLANISKETTGGWQLPVGAGTIGDYAKWGLYFVHEVGYTNTNSAGAYSQASTDYPPNSSVGYYGRGPIQLSWNYNYGQFSKFLYNDINVLLDNPNLIQQDGVLAFKSALWFWMMPQCPKPSCHQVMQELWHPQLGIYTQNKMYNKGFAHTNNIINGGLECRTSSSSAFTQKVVLRSELYKYYLSILGFSASEIILEDSGEYSTLCYESTSNAMENYTSCENNLLTLNNLQYNINSFNVFPNPIQTSVTITNNNIIDQISIYNIIGKKVYDATQKKKIITLNLNSFASGIYIAYLRTDKQTAIIKLIKQ